MIRQNKIVEKTMTRQLKLPFSLYLPADYEDGPNTKWPVVFFLHGAGERGNDLALVQKHGPVRQICEGKEFLFILVVPQCPENLTWDRSLDELDALLATIMETYRVDTERIYVTGLSMGGYGTWHWGARHPRAFAAMAPICGGTMPLMGFPERIAILKDVPIWVFHGEDDQVIPIERSKELVRVLRKLEAPVRFTSYAGVGHNSWDLAYGEQELFPWLLSQKNTRFSLERVDGSEQ